MVPCIQGIGGERVKHVHFKASFSFQYRDSTGSFSFMEKNTHKSFDSDTKIDCLYCFENIV